MWITAGSEGVNSIKIVKPSWFIRQFVYTPRQEGLKNASLSLTLETRAY